MTVEQSNRLLVITTGGTIDKIYFDRPSQYQVGDPAVHELLNEAHINLDCTFIEICRKDSLEITNDDRKQIAQAIQKHKIKRVLITHGTDTLVETACYLAPLIDSHCTVVMTGAFQPAIFRNSDAPMNIGTALGGLSTSQSGIFIAMSGQIFSADKVAKNYEKGYFEATE